MLGLQGGPAAVWALLLPADLLAALGAAGFFEASLLGAFVGELLVVAQLLLLHGGPLDEVRGCGGRRFRFSMEVGDAGGDPARSR